MMRPRISTTTLLRSLSVGAALMILPSSCVWKEEKVSEGAGGTTSTPSLVPTAGKPEITTSTPAGGEENGGAPNTKSEPTSGGSTSETTKATSLPDIDCKSDIECREAKLLCDTDKKKCVQCRVDTDCSDDLSCVDGICGGTPAPAGCQSNDDCADSPNGKSCDVQRGRCVACVTAGDCGDETKNECVHNKCNSITPCTNSLSCTDEKALVCDSEATVPHCVACVTTADCEAAKEGTVCSNNTCVASCSDDSPCADGLKCSSEQEVNYCAACFGNDDCEKSKFCEKGACVADICVAGTDQACIDGGVAKCNEAGSGFDAPAEKCPEAAACMAADSRASCGGILGCPNKSGTTNPCKQIPKFNGDQTVDGYGSDFCDIPSFKLTFQNAAKVTDIAEGVTASTIKEYAVAKVAWSEGALHAYVEVTGDPVSADSASGSAWNGDAVELFITTNTNAPGKTEDDSKAIHITANSVIAVMTKSNGEGGTSTPISDSAQYKPRYTEDGYAIELKIPWPDGAPSAGAAVRFEFALNVSTMRINEKWGRAAQAVIAFETLSGKSTCTAAQPTAFCDERLWCPTKLQ